MERMFIDNQCRRSGKVVLVLGKKIGTSLDFGGKKENENLDVKSCMVWFWVLNKNLVITTLNG